MRPRWASVSGGFDRDTHLCDKLVVAAHAALALLLLALAVGAHPLQLGIDRLLQRRLLPGLRSQPLALRLKPLAVVPLEG